MFSVEELGARLSLFGHTMLGVVSSPESWSRFSWELGSGQRYCGKDICILVGIVYGRFSQVLPTTTSLSASMWNTRGSKRLAAAGSDPQGRREAEDLEGKRWTYSLAECLKELDLPRSFFALESHDPMKFLEGQQASFDPRPLGCDSGLSSGANVGSGWRTVLTFLPALYRLPTTWKNVLAEPCRGLFRNRYLALWHSWKTKVVLLGRTDFSLIHHRSTLSEA